MTARQYRCAVYTRKSTEEGLEQDFNSLDAQREACTAYVASQKHEGWVLQKARYDDGGWSGGNMDRPALKQLLDDIALGRIDIIVVYKVDRLTRSLADFAKIVEILDKRKVSFVSVTQQFNTTTSMGRLTLNVLLSFAQFEREVTAERIRDKIAASKAKGMWMGGNIPLGYDVKARQLIVNPQEANQVRHIFNRYLAIGSVDKLRDELHRDGYRSKHRPGKKGKLAGGAAFSRGALYTILGNRLYIGEIRHKGKVWPGQHEAIVDRAIWDQASQHLDSQRRRRGELGGAAPALLAGLLTDEAGNKLTATHTRRHGRIYRYYVSKPPDGGKPKLRIAAEPFEAAIIDQLKRILVDDRRVAELASNAGNSPAAISSLIVNAKAAGARIDASQPDVVRAVLGGICVGEESVALRIRQDGLSLAASVGAESERPSSAEGSIWNVTLNARFKRRGGEGRLIIGQLSAGEADPALLANLGRAHAFRRMFIEGGMSLREIAAEYGCTHGYVSKILQIAWSSLQKP